MSAHNAVAVALMLVAASTSVAQEASIGTAEAQTLVDIVLRHQGFPASSRYCEVVSMDKSQSFVSGYYSFNASCDFPNTAATSPWGEYLVSPRTGDVLGFEQCKWFRYSDLRRSQKQVMLRTHATKAAEARYREKVGCTPMK